MSVNFWKLLSGRILSNIGDCFYNVSLIWLIYHLTGNTFYTGLTGFLVLAPMILQFLVGPLIEKFNKKLLLIATEAGQLVTVLAAFVLYETVWHHVGALIFLTPVVAFLTLFSNPAEMTLIPQFVDKNKLAAANSLMNVTYQTLQIVFTSLVGVLLIFISPLFLYIFSVLFNAGSALCFSLIRLRSNKTPVTEQADSAAGLVSGFKNYRRSLAEGFQTVSQTFIGRLLPATVVANLVLGTLTAVLPAYASSRGGSQWFGFFQSAETAGLLAGAAMAPIMKNIPLGRMTIFGFTVSGLAWLVSFFSANNALSVLLYAFSFVPIGVTNILFVSAIQRAVPQQKLAQIYTIIVSIGAGMTPVGSLAGGELARIWSLTPVFISIGVTFLFVSAYWFGDALLRKMPPAEQLGTGNYTITLDRPEK
ncbi:MFS transporter [Sporolactobacillus vineae]|uniref:MFS transporter n=1 Tax=Sporolactobacillus vineae TaxID=444463 RepID=UPI00028A0198|nr:MFS transporter [Sporolactobacillus vineae]